ncbi:hypothetical protein [Acrocarpospora corrugata]|uniref:hypothetical protein n=1 Tax=Acrocarpospora corrugata TaxID=35763 RepID=UPI0012D33484|nr:hypothetical protein [Acrocarpospora corrugata]
MPPQEVDQYGFLFNCFHVEVDLAMAQLSIQRRRLTVPVVDLILMFELIRKSLIREGFVEAAASRNQIMLVCRLVGEHVLVQAEGQSGEARVSFTEFLEFHRLASIRAMSMLYAAHQELHQNPYLAHVEEILDVVGVA